MDGMDTKTRANATYHFKYIYEKAWHGRVRKSVPSLGFSPGASDFQSPNCFNDPQTVGMPRRANMGLMGLYKLIFFVFDSYFIK